jgi:hypothetical protein
MKEHQEVYLLQTPDTPLRPVHLLGHPDYPQTSILRGEHRACRPGHVGRSYGQPRADEVERIRRRCTPSALPAAAWIDLHTANIPAVAPAASLNGVERDSWPDQRAKSVFTYPYDYDVSCSPVSGIRRLTENCIAEYGNIC